MTYIERKEKEKYLLHLIEKQQLVSLQMVASNFGCSKRTVKRMIYSLREEGYNIYYCKSNCKYFIEN